MGGGLHGGNDSVCQTSSARVVGWRKKKGTHVEVQKTAGCIYSLPLVGFGTPGRLLNSSCNSISHIWDYLYTPSSADVWDFPVSEPGNTHSHVPIRSLRSVTFVDVSGSVSELKTAQHLHKYGSFLPRVKIQQTDNTQQSNQGNTGTQKMNCIVCDMCEFHFHTVKFNLWQTTSVKAKS